MAQKNKKKSKKWLFIVLLVVLFVVAVLAAYFVGRAFFQDKAGVLDPQYGIEKEDYEEPIEKESEEVVEVNEMTEPEPKVVQYEGDDPNDAADLTGSLSMKERDGDMLRIRTNIDQYLSGGVCELILTRNGQNIYTEAERIIPNASTSTCEGFDVPVSELGTGNTKIIINLSSGGKTGVIEGEVKL